MKRLMSLMLGLAAIGLAAVATTGTAQAQGAKNWGGVYVGGSFGGAWGDSDWNFVNAGTRTSPSFDGWIGGGHIGVQHQWGNFVLGVEASLSGGDLDGSALCPNPTFNCQVNDVSWIFTVGPRFGWAVDNWLLYGSVGYAEAQIKTNTPRVATGIPFDATSDTHSGWNIGAGIEFALSRNLVLGVEYMHIDLDTTRHAGPGVDIRDIDGEMDIFRVRLSFLFGREAPAPAPMK